MSDSTRPGCLFGVKCYRRNPQHFRDYEHPHVQELCREFPGANDDIPKERLLAFDVAEEVVREQMAVIKKQIQTQPTLKRSNSDSNSNAREAPKKMAPPKQMSIDKKLTAALPMSVFLTKIRDSPSTHADPRSIYMADLLHPKLGLLKKSLQINFMVEWEWLQMNYEAMLGKKSEDIPLLIIHGEENIKLRQECLPKNVRALRVKPRYPFGTHHSKIMMFVYEDDSIRVVVSTANLVASDWENRTQGLWVSPKCPKMPKGSNEADGDSETGFKASFLRYLKFYELSPLKPYIEAVKTCDMSAVSAFFVSSVPNSHRGSRDLDLWGHRSIAAILRKHAASEEWPLIVQCSSIGSLGANDDVWFRGEFAKSLTAQPGVRADKIPSVKMIYPSRSDVLGSHDGLAGGGCLPYARKTHEKQKWLEKYLHHWRALGRDRNKAMPHIKSYTRVSHDCKKASYLLLTSANLSKAAWGSMNKAGDSLLIMSYEAGVLLLPKFVKSNAEFFDVAEMNLPFDLPLTPYGTTAEGPWFMDYLRDAL